MRYTDLFEGQIGVEQGAEALDPEYRHYFYVLLVIGYFPPFDGNNTGIDREIIYVQVGYRHYEEVHLL